MIDEEPLETVINQTCILPRVGKSGGADGPPAWELIIVWWVGAEPVAKGHSHPE